MNEMKNIILQKLNEIEEKEHVRILHCVESGSRAWGFASEDSDYDVRFIYVRPVEEYLRLDRTRDVIEWQLDDELDINGWDLQKALQLLHKSNPTLFEWRASPVVYRTTPDWEMISKTMEQYFVVKDSLYHYVNIAKNAVRTYQNKENIPIKKCFYILRPILACCWIMQKQTPPPMLFSELMESCLPEALKPEVNTLLELKKKVPETELGRHADFLNEYITQSFADIEAYIKGLSHEAPQDWNVLNAIFVDQVRKTV